MYSFNARSTFSHVESFTHSYVEDDTFGERTSSHDSMSSSNDTERLEYKCLAPSYMYVTSRLHDLRRHKAAKHEKDARRAGGNLTYDCPIKACTSKGAHGFKRKYHLRDHVRRCHVHELPREPGGAGKRHTAEGENEAKRGGGLTVQLIAWDERVTQGKLDVALIYLVRIMVLLRVILSSLDSLRSPFNVIVR